MIDLHQGFTGAELGGEPAYWRATLWQVAAIVHLAHGRLRKAIAAERSAWTEASAAVRRDLAGVRAARAGAAAPAGRRRSG